jgi:bifunctional ADP-heptose synthase (sugar kinase/adenylyltransferase)
MIFAILCHTIASLGDYVLVGVYRDSVVNKMCGHNLPILTMHERVLSVLGCKVGYIYRYIDIYT